jgi:uncharacterized protein YcgI (DUF1989 family)
MGMSESTSIVAVTIPARRGKATRLSQGQTVLIINTYGQQVIDTWAFNANDMTEFMSMEHTRTFLGRIIPKVGDRLVTNHRRPILTLLEDTSPGIHDTLLAACDRYRYELLGFPDHDNCTDNLATALAELGLQSAHTPSPLNLFMNIPVSTTYQIEFLPPVSQAGDAVRFQAEMDCIIAFSCCPQDVVPINGRNCQPTEAHFIVE